MTRRFTDPEVRAIAEATTDPVDGDALLQRCAEASGDRDRAWAMFEAVGQLRAGQPVDLGDGTFLVHETLEAVPPEGAVRMVEAE